METSTRQRLSLGGMAGSGKTLNQTILGVLLILVVLLSLPEASATQIFRWPGPLLFPFIFAGLAFWLIGVSVVGSEIRVPRPVWLLATIGLAASAIASSLSNGSLATSCFGVSLVLIAVLVFFGAYSAIEGSRGLSVYLATGISIVGGIITLVSLYRWGMIDIPMALGLMDPLNQLVGEELLQFSFAENRNANPFGHQNYTAGVMLLLIPWHARSMFYAAERMRLVWGIVVVLDLICLISTFSRGAWLGLAGAALFFVFWLGKRNAVSRKTLIRLTIGIALLGVLLIAANPRMRSSIARLATRGSTQVDQVRSTMAEAGWLMFKDNWLTGVGPGNVTTAYPKYRSQLAAGLEDNYQLHVTPLQIGVEQGLPGLIAWALLVFASWRTFRRLTNDDQSIAATAFFCLLAYGIFSFTDYQLDVIPIVILVFLNFALLAAGDTVRIEITSPTRYVAGLGVAMTSVVLLIVLVPELRGRALFNSAMASLREGEGEKFEEKTLQAIERAPSGQYYFNQLAAYHADQWANETDETSKNVELALAQRWFKKSLGENPVQEYGHFNLGWLLQDVEPLQSAGHFVEAARLVPDRKGVFRGLALSLMNAGRTNAACRALALECLANPTFVASAFWSHSGHGELWPPVYTNVIRDLRHAASDFAPQDSSGQVLERRRATLAWLETGRLDDVENQKWPPRWEEFWETVESNEKTSIRISTPKAPWKYLHDAWANADERESLVTSAVILATKKVPDDAVVSELVRWVSQEKWSDVIRNVPPPELFRAFGRQRSGFNLLARNMDGIKPTDVCAYIDNHIVELFFEFVYGNKSQVSSLFVLKRLDNIVDEVPTLREAVGRIQDSVVAR